MHNLYYTIGNLERIGDHSESLADLARRRMENGYAFSQQAVSDLQEMAQASLGALECAVDARAERTMTKARQAVRFEERADNLEEEMRESHMDRLSRGECRLESSVIFLDALSAFERIADHAKNIAGYVKEEI